MAVPGPLGLALATGAHGALMSASGSAADRIFYLGPRLRATDWETTAVAELREHAEQLAQRLLPVPYAQRIHAAPPRLGVERLRT